jgi:hypothetical protein
MLEWMLFRVITIDSRMLKLPYKAVLIALLGMGTRVHGVSATHDELRKALAEETERWSVLTYSQLYIYDKNEPVQYTGTVYLKIDSFSLEECDLKISVVVQDKYVGTEDQRQRFGKTVHKETKPKSDSYRYSYQLRLDEIDPVHVRTVLARPTQLIENTSLSCKEEKACILPWLQVVTRKRSISESRVMNGFEDVNQTVSQMLIPMTSSGVASQLAKILQNSATGCHRT